MLSVYAVGKYGQQELVNSIYYLAASLGCQASLVVATGCQCCHEEQVTTFQQESVGSKPKGRR